MTARERDLKQIFLQKKEEETPNTKPQNLPLVSDYTKKYVESTDE